MRPQCMNCHEHLRARACNRVRHALPGRNLLRRVDTGRAAVTLAREAGLGASEMISPHRRAASSSPATKGRGTPLRRRGYASWRHDDAVLQRQAGERGRFQRDFSLEMFSAMRRWYRGLGIVFAQ